MTEFEKKETAGMVVSKIAHYRKEVTIRKAWLDNWVDEMEKLVALVREYDARFNENTGSFYKGDYVISPTGLMKLGQVVQELHKAEDKLCDWEAHGIELGRDAE